MRRIADLARLSLDENELSSMAEQMRAIIGFANQLSSADTGDVPPMYHVHGDVNVMRMTRPRLPCRATFCSPPHRCKRTAAS